MMPIANWWALRKKFKQSIPGVVTDNYIATVLEMSVDSARANVLPDPLYNAADALRQYINLVKKYNLRLHGVCEGEGCGSLFLVGQGGRKFCSAQCWRNTPDRREYIKAYQEWANNSGCKHVWPHFPGVKKWKRYKTSKNE
jgi:hypothetical protein